MSTYLSYCCYIDKDSVETFFIEKTISLSIKTPLKPYMYLHHLKPHSIIGFKVFRTGHTLRTDF